jgi:RNA polymerase sigma-70 factor (ECF subfamily)
VGSLRTGSNVKSWLFTILRNIWLNQLRQWQAAPDIVEINPDGRGADGTADTLQDPHVIYLTKIERERVRAGIQQLPVEFREIIILREYEELSYQEIANILRCPLGTVMSRLARARSRLRDLLLPIGTIPPSQNEDSISNKGSTA